MWGGGRAQLFSTCKKESLTQKLKATICEKEKPRGKVVKVISNC